MIDQLKFQIAAVAKARIKADEASKLKQEAYAKWESDNLSLIGYAQATKEAVAVEETQLRELTLSIFKETQDKHPAPEVGIREVEKLEYDTKQAMAWATQHLLALKLDTSGFEKIVKASPEQFNFVTITKVATATIATEIKLEQGK